MRATENDVESLKVTEDLTAGSSTGQVGGHKYCRK